MFAEVVVDITHSEVDKKFDYFFSGDNILVGSRVIVPFGTQKTHGIVVKIKEHCDYDPSKVKRIIAPMDEKQALNEEAISLMHHIKNRYHTTFSQALRLFLPSEMRVSKVKEKVQKMVECTFDNLSIAKELVGSRAKKQLLALDYIFENKTQNLAVMNEKFSPSAVKGLVEKNLVKIFEISVNRSPYKEMKGEGKVVCLTPAQEKAIESFNSAKQMVTLLFGVTGSGKTEVYLNLIKNALECGKTAIMLVPEIALTPQMLTQLRAKFNSRAAIFHSGLSVGEKFDEWWRIRNGEASVVIGARSAIFAPLENIGVIIIDEEHDSSYYSEKNPKYSTIDIAKKRAEFNNAKIIIGSATPSIEAFSKGNSGEYNMVRLSERVNKRAMPEIVVADMRLEVRRGNNSNFSNILKAEIEQALANKNQVIIFLNRRGYSQNVICTECGYVPKCKNCDVSLTYHYDDESLKCHYCGDKFHMITQCPECGSKFLRYGNYGTQRVVLELEKLFKSAKIIRMDNDTTSKKNGHYNILEQFRNGSADILVGTQMIAKGHDFPKVTLVGILDADMSLHFSDYRSSERTFQLLTQVAGRSGRSDAVGKVVCQTYSPDNYVLNFAKTYDYIGFFNRECSIRQATKFPPFSTIIRVLISGENESDVLEVTKKINDDIKQLRLNNESAFCFFMSMKAPIKRLQNKFRYQVLMRINNGYESIFDKIYLITQKIENKKVFISMEENPTNLS